MLPALLSMPSLGDLIHFIAAHWVLVFLSLIPAVYWFSTRNHDYWKKRGIPSPPTTPFLGSFFSLSVPFPLLHKNYVREYGKVVGLFNGQRPQLLLADPELIKRILVRDFNQFRNRPRLSAGHRIFTQNLALARDEEWKRIRSILTPMFTSSKLRKMEGAMGGCVDSLLDSLEQMARTGRTFEARDPMGNFTMDVISKCAFATETNAHSGEYNVFCTNAKGFFIFRIWRTLGGMLLPRRLQRFLIDAKMRPLHLKEFDFFENLSQHLIRERREHKGDETHTDMLQLLVNAEHNESELKRTYAEDLSRETDGHHVNTGKEELEAEQAQLRNIIGSKYLSEEEIMAQAMGFFLAGYETTASTLSFCLFELALNPAIQERLYREIQEAKKEDPELSLLTLAKCNYLDAVVSETLRKYPPALTLAREASDDYYIPELKVTIEEDDFVLIPVYAVHHMEEFFPKPEQFDPDRFMPENRGKLVPYSYLPFGGGPRNCIGMRFALTEAKLGLAKILDRFEIVRVGETTDQLKILPGVAVLKTSPINLGVKVRN